MTLVPPQTFRKTEGIHRTGLAASRPAAADVLIGTLYFSTDSGAFERSNGTTWDAYAPALGLWTDIAFSGANYTSDTGTFVVNTQYALHYTLLGRTLVYAFYLNGTVTGTPLVLSIKLPPGLTAATYSGQVFNFGSSVGVILAAPASPTIGLYVNSTGATLWTAGTYFMVGTITLQVN